MSDGPRDFDSELAQMFEQAREPLAAEQFLRELSQRLRGARRTRLRRCIGIGLLLLALAGVLTPYAVRGSIALALCSGNLLPGLGRLLASPAGWAGALLVAFGLMRRAFASGR